jgi:hypothetical protein
MNSNQRLYLNQILDREELVQRRAARQFEAEIGLADGPNYAVRLAACRDRLTAIAAIRTWAGKQR